MGTAKSKHTTNKAYWAVVGLLVISACCLCAIALAYMPKKTTPAAVDNNAVVDQVAPNTEVPAPLPTDTIQFPTVPPELVSQLEILIREYLGASNRDLPQRLNQIFAENGSIFVEFALNHGDGVRTRSRIAKEDVAAILYLSANSGIDYYKVNVIGTYVVHDEYANLSEEWVLVLTYLRETLDKINWDNIGEIVDDIYDLTSEKFVHPELTDD